MSVRITLTDEIFPPSGEFVEFLEKWISNQPFDGRRWAEYGHERVKMLGLSDPEHAILERVDRLMGDGQGVRYIARAYELFTALLIGDEAALQDIQDRFRFFLVVGIPRSGGKYMTKQVFRALGYDPRSVPEVLGHDGFPDAGPWRFGRSGNSWVGSLHAMAEYLTMVEAFFGNSSPRRGAVVVPKKAMKAVYAPRLFQTVLGTSADGFVTVRHPVPTCISTYETAGGFPRDGRFASRGNIEKFCARDLIDLGFSREEIGNMDYFDAYLRYWESYHVRLAMGMSSVARNFRVVAYGAKRYMQEARRLSERFGAAQYSIEPFHVNDRQSYPREWIERAEPSLRRVADQWHRVGLEFPVADINATW